MKTILKLLFAIRSSLFARTGGFTLIETLIYTLMISGVLVSAVFFSLDILDGQQKARVYQEVQQNARSALDRVVQEIRAADDLNAASSTFDVHPGFLSLKNEIASKDPTVFGVSNYILGMKQGSSATTSLTTSNVKVTNFVVKNLSVTNRTKNVYVTLTVEHLNPENITIFNASTTMSTSVTIRDQEDLP